MRENAFEHKKKKSRVKFNPRLSANQPSNNLNQMYLFFVYRWMVHGPVTGGGGGGSISGGWGRG